MASAMHAARARLDVSAANLANVSSDGFQKRVAHATLSDRGLTTRNEADVTHGPLRHTGRNFDLATFGEGGFFVLEAHTGRIVEERSAAFERDAAGHLIDRQGRVLLGEHGPIVAGADATIDARGIVSDASADVGRVRLRSGAAVQSGFLEGSNVDAVREMVDVLAAERAFETAQKTLTAIDDVAAKETNELGRVKA